MLKIINFNKNYEKSTLRLFYKSVFFNRKEFEYARIPTWFYRYSDLKDSIKLLAIMDGKVVGSLGVLPYEGYVNKKKKKIGFFVDNCVLPEYLHEHDKIMSALFKEMEKRARRAGYKYIIGWDYTEKISEHLPLYNGLGYEVVDGINWFGGGTKPIHIICQNNFHISAVWKIMLRLYNLKYYLCERKLPRLEDDISIREMANKDLPEVVRVINHQNENMEFSPRYTINSLKKYIRKYHSECFIAEADKKIVGVLITFLGSWSGWMYGKPEYTKSYAIILIKHPLEFAVHPDYAEKIAPHLLLKAMKGENDKEYHMFVDVFDRRIAWMRKAYLAIGADELPYDYGSLIFKDLSGKRTTLERNVYIPTNLVINPITDVRYFGN